MMARYINGSRIHEPSGLPVENVSCPGCGFVYGYRKRTVCPECQECSECCRCPEPRPARISGKKMIEDLLENGL